MFTSSDRGLRQARESIAAAAVRAEAFDVSSVLERYKAEQGVDEAAARRHWRALVRFLMMVGHAGERGYGMYGTADALWHHLVLHTELYQSFCERHAGRFLHHHPGGSPRGRVWRSGYLRFLIDYRTVFDETPPADLWPMPVVSCVDLPDSAADLRWRHVKAMERLERAITARRGAAAAGFGGGNGCGTGSGGFGVDSDGGGPGGDSGGCGGGCSG